MCQKQNTINDDTISRKSLNDNRNRALNHNTFTNPPLNVYDLKIKLERFTTTTILNKNETLLFHKPDNEGYYGQYYLFDIKNEQPVQIGILTVFNSEKPWLYNNKTEKFIEITINSTGYFVFDSICIGLKPEKIYQYLGEPFIESDNIIVYSDTIDMIAIFKINNDTIDYIKVGRYNNNVLNNLEGNIDKLLQ